MTLSRTRRAIYAVTTALVAMTTLVTGTATAASTGVLQGERLHLATNAGRVVSDRHAAGGKALLIASNATATGTLTTGRTTRALTLVVRGDQCYGAPVMRVRLDGKVVRTVAVPQRTWTTVTVPGSWARGRHSLAVALVNDNRAKGCDRNLRLDRVALTSAPRAAAALAAPGAAVEAEQMALPKGSGQTFADSTASGGAGLLIWSNATATTALSTTTTTNRLTLVIRGDQCNGPPATTVRVNGTPVHATTVPSTTWTTITVPGTWAPGTHQVAISFTNDASAPGCDRNLRLDRVALTSATAPAPTPTPAPAPTPTPTPTTPASANPLSGMRLWVDPHSNSYQEIARRTGDTASITQLTKIAQQPNATWFGDWVPTSTVAASVSSTVSAAAGAVPVLVLYAIPHRDCGGYSAGGLSTPSAYAAWTRQVVAGIGTRQAIVVLEPDALASMSCLTASNQAARTAMLREAAGALAAAPGVVTYLDAGNSTWTAADVMATRLTDAGIALTDGFSLNVSNFNQTTDETVYGNALSARLGGAHYVIDTSRNGLGRATGDLAWCNPAGRALGNRPTTTTDQPAADGHLWVKTVGESDGECGRGDPSAGTWWADYAIGLASRTTW